MVFLAAPVDIMVLGKLLLKGHDMAQEPVVIKREDIWFTDDFIIYMALVCEGDVWAFRQQWVSGSKHTRNVFENMTVMLRCAALRAYDDKFFHYKRGHYTLLVGDQEPGAIMVKRLNGEVFFIQRDKDLGPVVRCLDETYRVNFDSGNTYVLIDVTDDGFFVLGDKFGETVTVMPEDFELVASMRLRDSDEKIGIACC